MASRERPCREHCPEPFHYYRDRGYFINSSEMSLRVLYEIEEEDVDAATRSLLSTRLGLSRAAVSEQLGRLTRDGDVVAESDRKFTLTGPGRARARAIVRRHRLIELLLVEVIGLPWELAHIEASRWQHVLTPRVEEKVAALLGAPTTSPFGCPIPHGDDPPRSAHTDAVQGELLLRLIDTADDEESRVRLRYLPEHLQNDRELLARLRAIAAVPGTVATVTLSGEQPDEVRIETATGSVTVDSRVSHGVLVEGTRRRAPPSRTRHRPAHRASPARSDGGRGPTA